MTKLLVFLLFASTALGQRKSVFEATGAEWQKWDDTYKVAYIAGFVSAMSDADFNVTVLCAFTLKVSLDSDQERGCAESAQALDFSKISIGQFEDGIDALYKDFRNTQYPVHSAMRLVRDQINGRSAEDVEKELTSWRQCHADSSKCVTAPTPDKKK